MAAVQSFTWKTLALLLPLAALTGCNDEKVATEEPVRPVKIVEIDKPDAGRTLQYSGSIRARTEIAMGFRVDGKLVERLVDVGQSVEAGDLLARLDPVDYELSVRQAEADLASTSKQVEISQLALRRAQILQEKSAASRSSLEQSQLAYEQAVSAREASASALEQARNRVGYSFLKSEVKGIVTAVSAEAGQVLSAGTPAVTVAADGTKEVEIAVPEIDIAAFKPGKTVKANFWSNSALTLEGTVREVAGSADAVSRTFLVRVSLPDDPRVLLGMTATVTTNADDTVPAFVLPLAALAKQDGKSVVWVVDPATQMVHVRTVTVSGFSDDAVRVTEGLAAGDIVVAAGTQFMTEDMKVRLPEELARTEPEAAPAAPLVRS